MFPRVKQVETRVGERNQRDAEVQEKKISEKKIVFIGHVLGNHMGLSLKIVGYPWFTLNNDTDTLRL